MRLTMYLPSGESAARLAVPESVPLVTEIFWNGIVWWRKKMEYPSRPANINAMPVPRKRIGAFDLAGGTGPEMCWLSLEDGAATIVPELSRTATAAEEEEEGLRPGSRSRFRRFRSPRRSAADW